MASKGKNPSLTAEEKLNIAVEALMPDADHQVIADKYQLVVKGADIVTSLADKLHQRAMGIFDTQNTYYPLEPLNVKALAAPDREKLHFFFKILLSYLYKRVLVEPSAYKRYRSKLVLPPTIYAAYLDCSNNKDKTMEQLDVHILETLGGMDAIKLEKLRNRINCTITRYEKNFRALLARKRRELPKYIYILFHLSLPILYPHIRVTLPNQFWISQKYNPKQLHYFFDFASAEPSNILSDLKNNTKKLYFGSRSFSVHREKSGTASEYDLKMEHKPVVSIRFIIANYCPEKFQKSQFLENDAIKTALSDNNAGNIPVVHNSKPESELVELILYKSDNTHEKHLYYAESGQSLVFIKKEKGITGV